MCEPKLHQIRSLDGTIYVLRERKRDSLLLNSVGNTFGTVRGSKLGLFFHSGSETSTFPFVSLMLVTLQLVQTSRFYHSGSSLLHWELLILVDKCIM